MLKSYITKLYEIASRGDAREESYYSALEVLLKKYAESQGKRNIYITTLPKNTEAGNPDFRVWDGKQHIVGYIEAKEPKVEFLDKIEGSEQLKRYRHTFPNLLLTNFFEFRLYRDGQFIEKVQIGRPLLFQKNKVVQPVENEDKFLNLLDKYFSFSLPKTYNAKSLAVELAKRTRFLKDVVNEEMSVAVEQKSEQVERPQPSPLQGFYDAFHKHLIAGLSKEEFADLYSQTLTYGLFAARTRAEGEFNRKLAYDNIPHTIGILRDVFKFISLGDLPKQMEWIIDDIAEVLAVTDVKKILHRYFHEGKGKDPIVHFYETFLTEYDPKAREKRGVYYTPEPVVSYIVRSLHQILKEKFNRPYGLATDSVTVLDPAAGTLTFLAEAATLAVKESVDKFGDRGKEHFIKDHILKNFYAFELMMAPYAIGHIKMSFLLEELGYRMSEEDRCKFYLTNTLDMEEMAQTDVPGLVSLSEESHLAGRVKTEQPILVILGNPPYSGHSANLSEKYITLEVKAKGKQSGKAIVKKVKTWIGNLIEDYKLVDGEPLGEKNPKWLQDDYVKFIRFAQWKIDQASEGVLGFITNHSYLDNPTFRGMRRSLMKSFNEIYILDLHGNSLKKEKCSDGSKDENVFDIQQGVAIILAIKNKKVGAGLKPAPPEPVVNHAELWGLREKKYDWLGENDITITPWKELSPRADMYLFVPRDDRQAEHYERFIKITDIFPVHSVGIVTSRDAFVIDHDKEALKRRIRQFRDKNMPDEVIKDFFGLGNTSGFNLKGAREKIAKDQDWEEALTQILYRPFDIRWIFYHDEVIERSRKEVMRHMMHDNLGLITNRQVNGEFRHVLCADMIINDCTVSLETKERSYLFPLYLYKTQEKSKKSSSSGTLLMLFEPQAEYQIKRPNLSPKLIAQIKALDCTPEQIFYYIYAVLYSNAYRTKYAELLRTDFPRVPFTKDYNLFNSLSELGKRLADLHLMKSPDLDSPIARFQGVGEDKVVKPRYDEAEHRVYINETVYFDGVTPGVWEYKIGGYQVCEKWLKGRKGQKLDGEFKQYCRIVTAIQKTIEVQKEIDGVYEGVEKETVVVI